MEELSGGLRIIALRALGDLDSADDAVQDVMLRVVAVLEGRGIPNGYTLQSYAYGTLKHVIADYVRSRKRFFPLPVFLPSEQPSPLEQLTQAERTAALATLLGKLDREDRELLERCFWRGEKVAEIARATGEPADRIRKRKSRALERLRAALRSGDSHVLPDPSD